MTTNYDKSQFTLSTSTSVQSNLPVSGNANAQGNPPYNGTNLISTWNSISLRKIIRNVYDKYTRIYLEVYLITTGFVYTSMGANATWDQFHILKLAGLKFINEADNFVYIAPFRTTHNYFTYAPILENNGVIIDISSDDYVTLSSTLLNCDFTPHCSGGGWPHYNIFFNATGIPGYERITKEPNKNNY